MPVGAARILPGAEPFGFGEPLLSTEYDASGSQLASEGPALPMLTLEADHGLELGPGRLYFGLPDDTSPQSSSGGIAVYALGAGASATLLAL